MKVTVMPILIDALGTDTKDLVERNKRTSGDHPNYSIAEIGQNTKKSDGDLMRLAVSQAAEKTLR